MKTIRNELNLFFTALMFFSRIPCPRQIDHSGEKLSQSRRYFPLVGTVIGLIASFAYLALEPITSKSIAIVFSTIISIFITGAFHEDGFADFIDGFGGGWTKAQILEIMKDSRLGTFGATALLLLIFFKVTLLFEIARYELVIASLILGHTLSRFIASMVVQVSEYVQEETLSKSKPIASQRISHSVQLLSAIPVLFLLSFYPEFLMPSILSFLPLFYLIPLMKKKIGGYTGDCLGACQQITEVSIYLGIVIKCKFQL